jgi:cAMP-dependent protein kinase regulator
VHPKTDDVKKALKDRLDQAFMFSALNPAELDIVLNAMNSVSKKAGEDIIRQGDDGDNLYVVEKGTLTCSKVFVRNLRTH